MGAFVFAFLGFEDLLLADGAEGFGWSAAGLAVDAEARGAHFRDEKGALLEEFFGGVVPTTPAGVSSWVSAHFVAQVTEASVEAFPALGDRG